MISLADEKPSERRVVETEIQRVIAMLRSYRLRASTEAVLQADVESVLVTHGVEHVREHGVPSGRLDFFLPGSGIGIELKIGGSAAELARQILRYLEEPEVRGMLVVTTRQSHRGIPTALSPKPILIYHLIGSAF